MSSQKNYFYQYKITSVNNKDIKYLKTSTNINDILTCYIELTTEQDKFYSENPNSTYLEVWNCKLNEIVVIEAPIETGTTTIPDNSTTTGETYAQLVREYIAEKYTKDDEFAIINNFMYQGNTASYAEEYGVYQLYRVECKERAKKIISEQNS